MPRGKFKKEVISSMKPFLLGLSFTYKTKKTSPKLQVSPEFGDESPCLPGEFFIGPAKLRLHNLFLRIRPNRLGKY
jgi:hypothetical protein